jgi:hypothetical protein
VIAPSQEKLRGKWVGAQECEKEIPKVLKSMALLLTGHVLQALALMERQ